MSPPNAHTTNGFSAHNDLRRRGTFSDVTIKIADKSFPCHRIMLASDSTYFEKIFLNGNREGRQDEIELRDVDADDFELLLQRIYGEAVILSHEQNAYRLLRVCHQLEFKNMNSLHAYLLAKIESIPLETVVRMYKFADRSGEKVFSINLAKFLAQNFAVVDKTDGCELLDLSGSELLTVFEQPSFKVPSIDTFNFLARWAKFQSSKNREMLPSLMQFIQLQDLPTEALAKIMAENMGSSNGESIIKGVSEIDLNDDEHAPLRLNGNCARKSPCNGQLSDLPFTLYTSDICLDSNIPYKVNKYRAENLSHLSFLETISENMVIDLKAVVVNGIKYRVTNEESMIDYDIHILRPFVYTERAKNQLKEQTLSKVNGKSTTQIAASNMEIYAYNGDLHSYWCELDSWNCVKDSFKARVRDGNMTSYDDSLYLIGGVCENPTNYGDEGKYFQRYDTRVGKGVLLSPMKYTHIKPASCIYKDVLYVSGGENLSYYTGPIECFDFRAGKWDVFETSLPWPSFGHIMIPYDNKLWFFGGWNYRDEKYDFSLNCNLTWFYYDMREHKWSDNNSLPNRIRNFEIKQIFDVVAEI